MKVIFLDNDGVICLEQNWGSRSKKKKAVKKPTDGSDWPVDCRFDNFDKKSIDLLNSILEETGAEIVVSSDWRHYATVDEMGDYYISQGIAKRPIAFTENIRDTSLIENIDYSRYSEQAEATRHLEILQYIQDHPEITDWVAVDDLHMGKRVEASRYGAFDRDWGLTNFVWTPQSREGIKQSGVKEKIINFLNGTI
jgi:hypothetical protein